MHCPVGKKTTQLFWQLPDQTTWLREAERPVKEEEAGWLHPMHSDGRKEQASSESPVKGLLPPLAPGCGHLSTAVPRPAWARGHRLIWWA